tara:strand:- start:163 stop:360 length:198 start_codon:yes stop_codon:yes gene_type:complete
MKLHQQRVMDEKIELDAKAKVLSDFIGNKLLFEGIEADEQERLKLQNDIMLQYSEILAERIKYFV